MTAGWFAALRRPAWYAAHRVPVVVAMRCAMAVTSAWSSAVMQGGQLTSSMRYSSPAFTVLSKVFLISNAGQVCL
jgi:hypothetical protein